MIKSEKVCEKACGVVLESPVALELGRQTQEAHCLKGSVGCIESSVPVWVIKKNLPKKKKRLVLLKVSKLSE